MPVFNYIALNQKTGETVSGAMDVPNQQALETKLTDMGFSLTKASQVKKRKKLINTISRKDMIDFYTLMIFQVKAGVSVPDALDTAAGECKHDKLKGILEHVHRKVKSGLMFFEALDGHREAFPPNVVNMIRAGEMSCRLPETFTELREYEKWLLSMQADIRQATIYPIIILTIITAFVLLLFTMVIPKFILLLDQLDVGLPLITKIVFSASDFLKATWWMIVFGALSIFFGIKFGRKRSEFICHQLDRFKLALPIFGELNRMISISRLTHNVGSMIGAGLTVLDALGHCSELVGNKVVEYAVSEIKDEVKGGAEFSDALAKHPVIPEMVIKMASLGENTGSLEDALENASLYYNDVIPRKIKKIFSILEPLLMLFIIGLVGVVALSIFLPIMEMMTAAGNNR